MDQYFKGIHWNTNDLIGCKQALEMLYKDGVSVKILLTLNFGSLWTEGVLEEMGAL